MHSPAIGGYYDDVMVQAIRRIALRLLGFNHAPDERFWRQLAMQRMNDRRNYGYDDILSS